MDIVDARDFGSRCPGKQLVQIPGSDIRESEDCLTINIFRPKFHHSQKLPVALYVHGGAFNRGAAAMHNTASMVAWSEEPFIGVSFNYRIGALGFLPSRQSADEGILNLGLKDQILAMQWVHDNIHYFGGDPDQVTLFGLSAGAHSIGHHLMNYNLTSPSLFHRVIIESGAPTSRAVHPYNAPIHRTQFNEFLLEAGCSSSFTTPEIFSCLRSQPEKTITDAQTTIFSKYNPALTWAFQPVIDDEGGVIPRKPIDSWNLGLWNSGIPIMTGFSHNEGTMYVPSSMSKPDEFRRFFRTLIPLLNDSDLQTIEELYPDPSTYPNSPYTDTRNLTAIQIGPQFKRVEAAYAHYAYVCPVRQTAHFASSQTQAPVYVYHWALNQTVKGGANHGDHIGYQTMDDDVLQYSDVQRDVAETMHAYWTSFITMGDPNALKGRASDRPVWLEYRKANIMVFGRGNDERAGGGGVGVTAKMEQDGWSSEECPFWWEKTVLSEM
uniref:Carboxylic ester hydrolase n=1 Tax=Moniliophthora roreri TaxID=221103 RepID=A0A0W0FR75_MONRR